MTQDALNHRLCLMLAFQTVVAHGRQSESMAEKVFELARRMNEFCSLHLRDTFPPATMTFADDAAAMAIDDAIDQHIKELKTKEQTHLPEDKETLIKFYDRLQQRKARRMQWQFYATAKEEKIADLVLRLLDEEIEETQGEPRQ